MKRLYEDISSDEASDAESVASVTSLLKSSPHKSDTSDAPGASSGTGKHIPVIVTQRGPKRGRRHPPPPRTDSEESEDSEASDTGDLDHELNLSPYRSV